MLSTGAIAAVFVAVWLCGVDLLWVLVTNGVLNPGPRRTALRALFGGIAGLVVFSVFTLTGPRLGVSLIAWFGSASLVFAVNALVVAGIPIVLPRLFDTKP